MLTQMKEWQIKLGDPDPLAPPGPPQDSRFIPPIGEKAARHD